MKENKIAVLVVSVIALVLIFSQYKSYKEKKQFQESIRRSQVFTSCRQDEAIGRITSKVEMDACLREGGYKGNY